MMETTRSKSEKKPSATSSEKDDKSIATAAIFTLENHSILTSLDPSAMIKFIEKRAEYELQIKEKKKEIPTLIAASYKVSIEPRLLNSMQFMEEFDKIAPETPLETITSAHIKTYITNIVSIDNSNEPDSQVIEKALLGLKNPMNIAGHKARIKQLVADYFNRMDNIGYSNFRNTNKKMTIKHLVSALHPPTLKKLIEKDMEYQIPLKTELKTFIEHVDKAQEFAKKTLPKSSDSTKTGNSRSKNSSQATTGKEKPLCRIPEHRAKGMRCYRSQCSGCTKEEGAKFVKNTRKNYSAIKNREKRRR